MPEAVSYRRMAAGEEKEVSNLVTRVFRTHVAPLFSRQGVEEFLRYVTSGAMKQRGEHSHFVLVALSDQRIVGAIEVRDYDHVSLLFVDSAFQRQGVGRELVERALTICQQHRPTLRTIDVHSSPNAVPAYQRLGFQERGPERVEDGIRFVRMVREIT